MPEESIHRDENDPLNDPDPSPAKRGAPRCEILLLNPSRYQEVAARRLRPWLQDLVTEMAPPATSLAIRFTSDREMQSLNAQWRGKDRPTDVLSFPAELRGFPADLPASSTSPGDDQHLGDIAISVPTARRQARHSDHSLEQEFRTLILHGLLHCLGYDHETDDGEMKRLETELRRRWITP